MNTPENYRYLESLHLEATNETPEVQLDVEGVCYIKGRSLPENAYEFYEPILNWIKTMVNSNVKSFSLEVQLEYFNSSSGRFIYEIIHYLDVSPNKNGYSIVWRYEVGDDLMLERGQAFEALSSVVFTFIEDVSR